MTIISTRDAILLAQGKIAELAAEAKDAFQMLPDATEEISEGWVFFYNTRDFIQTGESLSALAGNGPILITRAGAVIQLGTASPWAEYVRQLPHSN